MSAILLARPGAEPALRAWLAEAGTLARYAASHPAAVELHGRGSVHAVPSPLAGGGGWVVRHYRRGGLLAPALGDRYLRARTPRPFLEYELARALEALDIPTPPVVGAAVYPAGLFYRGDLVTERVQGAVDLAAVLFGADRLPAPPGSGSGAPESGATGSGAAGSPPADSPAPAREAHIPAPAAMAAVGRLIRQLHDNGLVHPDLNLKNLLIIGDAQPRAMVLDLDRARLVERVAHRGRRRMLDRFWRSVTKWESRSGRAIDPDARRAFTAAYDADAAGR